MLDFRAPYRRAPVRLPFYSRLMEILFLLQVIQTLFFLFFLMIVVSSARDRFNFISSKLPLYDTFVFIRSPVATAARQRAKQPPGNGYGQTNHKVLPTGRLYYRLSVLIRNHWRLTTTASHEKGRTQH